MDKYSVDYEQLDVGVNPRKIYRLADVKSRIEKVAFDVVRFVDPEDIDGLWKIERRNDEEVIVSMYEDDNSIEITASSKSAWAAIPDKTKNYVSVYYKGEPVKKIALASVGLKQSDAYMLARTLPNSLASNPALVRKMVNELGSEDKELLVKKYPELLK
jgi:hypothetical protein